MNSDSFLERQLLVGATAVLKATDSNSLHQHVVDDAKGIYHRSLKYRAFRVIDLILELLARYLRWTLKVDTNMKLSCPRIDLF